MSSFQTFFRTVVMLATMGLVAKAWYHYGPTVDELQVIALRVTELAQQAWVDYWQSSDSSSALADDPQLPPSAGPPAPFVPSGDSMQPMPVVPGLRSATTAPSVGPVQFAGGVSGELVPATASPPPPSPSSPWPGGNVAQPVSPSNQDPRLAAILERLTQSGVRDQQLAPWGSGGRLVRFSCSVPWSKSPGYSRHFEAVAATPTAAVEQVAADIDGWRSGQQVPASSQR
jgi:hypothetical protein